ncbi:MAG: C40 family peptidase, partial [Acidimicrobiales bacterium]
QQKIATEVAASQAQAAVTAGNLTTAREVVAQQAIAAYIAGDGPGAGFIPGRAGNDLSLVSGYADAIEMVQESALNNYDTLSAQQAQEQAQLTAEQEAAATGLAQVESSERSAQAASQAEQATLAQVNGQLAVLVTADQQAASQAQAAQVESQLNQQGQNAPAATSPSSPSPGSSASSPPATTAPTASPSTAAPNTAAPTTSPPITAAPTTAPTTAPPTTAPPTTAPPTTRAPTPPTTAAPAPAPSNGLDPQASGVAAALAYAQAQIGKPYQWAGAGPGSFDCSGLVMMAWGPAGVSFPHLAQSQYDMTQRETIGQAVPGDLIFYGTPDDVYHVGIYMGGGQMIDAPTTGLSIQVRSIYFDGLLGAGRVHA